MKKSMLFFIATSLLITLYGCQKDGVRDESGFDQNSRIVESIAYYPDGQEYIKMTYLYDGRGRLARYRHYIGGKIHRNPL